MTHNGHNGYVNTGHKTEDDYGFSGNGHPHQLNNAGPNGYADMSGLKPTDNDDKWYLKDSMRPVGAASHGQTCKCYRCQRKLTAI